jgi:hypothetical protein
LLLPRHALHAAVLRFPVLGDIVEVKCGLPSDLRAFAGEVAVIGA